jgi:hypothetical protein
MAITDNRGKVKQAMVGLPALVTIPFVENKFLPLFLSYVCMVLPQHRYSNEALIPRGDFSRILDGFRRQHFADEIIYLRGSTSSLLPIG